MENLDTNNSTTIMTNENCYTISSPLSSATHCHPQQHHQQQQSSSSTSTLTSLNFPPIESMKYYYGNISRETAEWILSDGGCHEGMFLLRQSSDDYVLSLCHNKR